MRRRPFLAGLLGYALTACRKHSKKEASVEDSGALSEDSLIEEIEEGEDCLPQELSISLSDYPELRTVGGSSIVSFPEQFVHLLVVCIAEKQWIGVWKICTHGDCDVEWDETVASVRCPCHNSLFDIDGQVLQGPADRALKSYLVCEKQDKLYFLVAE